MKPIYIKIFLSILGLLVGFIEPFFMIFGFFVNNEYKMEAISNYFKINNGLFETGFFFLQFILLIGFISLIIYFLSSEEGKNNVTYFCVSACVGILPVIMIFIYIASSMAKALYPF